MTSRIRHSVALTAAILALLIGASAGTDGFRCGDHVYPGSAVVTR